MERLAGDVSVTSLDAERGGKKSNCPPRGFAERAAADRLNGSVLREVERFGQVAHRRVAVGDEGLVAGGEAIEVGQVEALD